MKKHILEIKNSNRIFYKFILLIIIFIISLILDTIFVENYAFAKNESPNQNSSHSNINKETSDSLVLNGKKGVPRIKKPFHKGFNWSEIKKIHIITEHGDKITNTYILPEKEKFKIIFTSNAGLLVNKELKKKNYSFIVQELKKLPVAPRIPSECHRSKMTIQVQSNNGSSIKKISCIALRTITSKDYTRFANIIALAL